MAEIIFYILAFGACVCALLTVISRHVFHGAVWLSLCLLSIAGIYFYLDAEFLGVIQVLVYIGGIITLFIFAIKLTARMDDLTITQTNRQLVPSALLGLALFGIFVSVIKLTPWASTATGAKISLNDLGQSLMTTYVLPFEFISVLLLAVMVGAIVLGRAKR